MQNKINTGKRKDNLQRIIYIEADSHKGIFSRFFLGVMIVSLLSFIIIVADEGRINTSEYDIIVESQVIDYLNERYDQSKEKSFYIDGWIDDEEKKIYIDEIGEAESYITQEKNKVSPLFGKNAIGKIGRIHTHPKILNLFPECTFSMQDAYSFGRLYEMSEVRISGVYCGKDRIAFYFYNKEAGELYEKVGYIKE